MSWSLPSYTVVENKHHIEHGSLVLWVSYLPSPLQIYLFAFSVLPLMRFFLFVHLIDYYYTVTCGKVAKSQVVLKRISHYFKALTPPCLIPLYISRPEPSFHAIFQRQTFMDCVKPEH